MINLCGRINKPVISLRPGSGNRGRKDLDGHVIGDPHALQLVDVALLLVAAILHGDRGPVAELVLNAPT